MNESRVDEPRTECSARPGVLWRIWPYLFIAVLSIFASSIHVARSTPLSAIDETRNVDYLVQLWDDGHLVRLGDRIGQTAMRLEACRGLDAVLDGPPPPCSTKRFDPRDFRDDGYNNAVNHPPGYHLVTGAVAKVTTLLGISNNLLDPARLVGGFWLAAGLMLAIYAGELLGISRVALVAAAAIFGLAPDALNSAAIVNPDGASLFAGGLILVAALLWERGRISIRWLAVAGGLAAAFKMTNFLAIAIVVAWFLLQAYRQRSDPDPDRPGVRPYVVASVVLLVGAIAVTIVWLGIAGLRATVDALDLPSNQMFYNSHFPRRPLLDSQNLFAFFPPGGFAYRAPIIFTQVIRDLAYISGWLSAAALFAHALRFRIRDRLSTLGATATALTIVGAPAFIVGTWMANKVVFQPSPRYALSAFPIIIVLLAALLKGRTATIAICTYAGISTAIIFGTLLLG